MKNLSLVFLEQIAYIILNINIVRPSISIFSATIQNKLNAKKFDSLMRHARTKLDCNIHLKRLNSASSGQVCGEALYFHGNMDAKKSNNVFIDYGLPTSKRIKRFYKISQEDNANFMYFNLSTISINPGALYEQTERNIKVSIIYSALKSLKKEINIFAIHFSETAAKVKAALGDKSRLTLYRPHKGDADHLIKRRRGKAMPCTAIYIAAISSAHLASTLSLLVSLRPMDLRKNMRDILFPVRLISSVMHLSASFSSVNLKNLFTLNTARCMLTSSLSDILLDLCTAPELTPVNSRLAISMLPAKIFHSLAARYKKEIKIHCSCFIFLYSLALTTSLLHEENYLRKAAETILTLFCRPSRSTDDKIRLSFPKVSVITHRERLRKEKRKNKEIEADENPLYRS